MTDNARLEPGDKAPAFSLPDADGKKVSLADFKGRRVIVYFYPAASTPGCTKQACDFRDSLERAQRRRPRCRRHLPRQAGEAGQVPRRRGPDLPAALRSRARRCSTAYGAFGEKKMYGKTVQGVIRSTFVVDEKGKVAEAQYNVKAAHTTTKIKRFLELYGPQSDV